MKSFKKTVSAILLLSILLLAVTSLTGCYVVKSSKMRKIEGTYKLTNYSTDENEIETRGITMYMVVKSDGNGYFAYKDNDTDLYFAEMRCRFTQDTEDSSKYSYVEVNFDGGSEWEKFGVNAYGKTLNSSVPVYKGNIFDGDFGVDYYISVTFTRESRAKDLSYIEREIGESEVLPYGLVKTDGLYRFDAPFTDEFSYFNPEGYEVPFVYFFIDIDVFNDSLKAYYMLKSDEKETVTELKLSNITTGSGIYTFTVGERDIKVTVSGANIHYLSIDEKVTHDGTDYDIYYKFYYSGDVDDGYLREMIEERKASYNASK